MTTLREAATQALGALEVLDRVVLSRHAQEAITALKAALVEDAMQKFTDVNQELEAALAEPVQEPVAWMTVRLNVPIQTTARKDVADEWLKWGEVLPLYTAPPQRKPLTREKAIALWADKSDGPSNGEIVSYCRAIERAHGIT